MKAPYIKFREVHRRFVFDYPFRQGLSRTAGRLDADRVETSRDIKLSKARRFAQNVTVVGREALGSDEQLPNFSLGEGGNALEPRIHKDLELVPVFRQSLEFEAVGDAFHAPRLGIRLETAQNQPTNLLLYVNIAVHIAQDGLIAHNAFHRSGYDVVMLRGMQRNVDAKRRTEIACPHAGANNDDVGLDASLVGLGTDRATVCGQNLGHLDRFDNLGATVARTPRQGLCGVGRVGHAVRRDEVSGK